MTESVLPRTPDAEPRPQPDTFTAEGASGGLYEMVTDTMRRVTALHGVGRQHSSPPRIFFWDGPGRTQLPNPSGSVLGTCCHCHSTSFFQSWSRGPRIYDHAASGPGRVAAARPHRARIARRRPDYAALAR